MKKPYSVTLELNDNFVQAVDFNNILYTQGDAETMPLTIVLTHEYGKPFTPSPGALATLNFSVDNIGWPRTQSFRSDGTLLYEVKPEDIAIPGTVTVSVTVNEGDPRLTWQGFTYVVANNLADGQTEAPDYLEPWIAAMMRELAELKIRVAELEEGGGEPEPPEIQFFLGTPPAQSGVSYVITAAGIIEANKVIM